MIGLNTVHDVSQALEVGKLFHIDLGAQKTNRYDQDFRFGAEDMKETFFLVKLLQDTGYDGPRAFDVKPYRADAPEEVWDLVRGCIRSYLILKEKVERFNQDPEIQALLRQPKGADGQVLEWQKWTPEGAQQLKTHNFDLAALANYPFGYQRLDQLVFELLAGIR